VVVASAFLVKSTIKPFNITSVLSSKDKAFKSYQEHERKYRDEMQIYILLESEVAWTKRSDFFDKLALTTTELKKVPQLANVGSLFDAEYVVREKDRTFLRTFFDHKVLRSEGLAKLRSEMIYQNSFIDKTEKATLIAVRLRENTSKAGPSPVIGSINQVLARLEAVDPTIKGHILGTEVARDAFVSEVIQGQTKLLPLILLLILGLMWLLFRSWRVCFLSFYVMALSYFLTVAFITLCEGSINPFSSFALLFILIISTADLVHLFSALAHRTETDPRERLSKAIEVIRKPCWICAVTTWIGLLSLLAANIPPVRWFGVYCALGSAIAFFLTFYLLPKLILLFRVDLDLQKPIQKIEGINVHAWSARFRWL
jgi:predicted RND superfamily exporter protein